MTKIKRAYDPPEPEDGQRVLVDRLWPRGLAKERASVDDWIKEVAPSDGLRRWFAHDPARFEEFRRRYLEELAGQGALVEELRGRARSGTLTLLYAAREREYNNAVVLKELLEREEGQ